MKRRSGNRHGSALMFALLAVVVVATAAVVLQSRSEETIRRRITDRTVAAARLRAESAIDTLRAAIARGEDPVSLTGSDADGTTTSIRTRTDGSLDVVAIGVVGSGGGPVAASVRLDVTLRPVPDGLPAVVAWHEPGSAALSE